MHEFDDNHILCGMRNGCIRLFDTRSTDSILLGSLPIRCDHGQAIAGSQFVLFQDMIGNFRMYDIRRPRAYLCEYVRAYQKECAFRNRRFLVDENEQYICITKDGGELQALSIRTQQIVNTVQLSEGVDLMLPGNPVVLRNSESFSAPMMDRNPLLPTSPWRSIPIAGLDLRSATLHFRQI